MDDSIHRCDLCGLPLRHGDHTARFDAKVLHFCCAGCQMVYAMLLEASDAPDPAQFKQTELYRRCVAAGVVPADESQLAETDRNAQRDSQQLQDLTVQTLSRRFKVQGMWCPACSWVIHAALLRTDGVVEAACDFATDRLRCRYDPTRVDPATISKTVENLGYDIVDEAGETKHDPHRRTFVRLMATALLSANIMMLSWALYSGFFTSLDASDIYYISVPIMVMATAVMIYGGGPLYRKAWWGLRARAPGMEALVCMGAGSAYLYSVINFWLGSWHLYFDTAAMLITLVLLGKLLEAKAKRNVRQDLESFLALQPNKVRICSEQYPSGRFAAIDQLNTGDFFKVKAEEIVPADGRVTAGKALVDVSAVTGESRPQSVGQDDSVVSGTRLLKGDVTVKARKVGAASLLGQMIAIIEHGLSRQVVGQNPTDRYLALFVPIMVGLSVATAATGHWLGLSLEQSFVRGLTVMVIACPCALGIAIPLARIAGLSSAGRKGILVRDLSAFEQTKGIDTVVIDKTGTLTMGQWAMSEMVVHDDSQPDQMLKLAAGLERSADHAVARSISTYARQHRIKPAEMADIEIDARGVQGNFEHQRIKIGTWDFICGGNTTGPPPKMNNRLESHVYMSLDHQLCATFKFRDQLRPSAQRLIQQLNDARVSIFLVSGDAHESTQALAAEVGIQQAQGDLLPQDKAGCVRRLQAQGKRVAMLGDGINDAPALAQSDLSVALHHDSALAQQAAVVTLMQGDPMQYITFIDLAHRVNHKVIQNLGCAWIYNLISIPIAMSGLLNPLLAASAMLLSSLTVIGNTLLLAKKK